MNEDSPDAAKQSKRAYQSAMKKLGEVQALYASLRIELQGDLFWRHHRSVSPGLQE